jgi:hypothetical protein
MIRREGLVTKLQVLNAISDNISVKMFRMIAADSETSEGLMDKLGVSRKQYYDRMCKLYAAGLITRRGRQICAYIIWTFNLSCTDGSCQSKRPSLETKGN